MYLFWFWWDYYFEEDKKNPFWRFATAATTTAAQRYPTPDATKLLNFARGDQKYTTISAIQLDSANWIGDWYPNRKENFSCEQVFRNSRQNSANSEWGFDHLSEIRVSRALRIQSDKMVHLVFWAVQIGPGLMWPPCAPQLIGRIARLTGNVSLCASLHHHHHSIFIHPAKPMRWKITNRIAIAGRPSTPWCEHVNEISLQRESYKWRRKNWKRKTKQKKINK